ncbi:hypothetical protein BN6_45670 [Saccharothrix espanaensis DSM 44229]|uniref:Uncharacterized protein n=1 Tax=Saccharothrix espanaensis (strain ATCC 51144 / DSM 44229 / JCM 9112 / NBRC 15066 / NRRL 15764) TaxID=1179773 RepID=K0K0H4_SACES|nr:hypothetical protein BN6_45670 [Saccharothrix espanaensis DSM 44229]
MIAGSSPRSLNRGSPAPSITLTVSGEGGWGHPVERLGGVPCRAQVVWCHVALPVLVAMPAQAHPDDCTAYLADQGYEITDKVDGSCWAGWRG